jgi:hypothetical protein
MVRNMKSHHPSKPRHGKPNYQKTALSASAKMWSCLSVAAFFHPETGHDLPEILGTWKSVSTRLINKARNRRGSVWQCESYDHLIRDEAEFAHEVEYILDNARHAGLRGWPRVYVKGR